MFVLDNYSKMVFKTENQYGVFYKVGLSKKDRNGNYINGYLNVRFKKGVSLENKTKICIKNGFIDFYLDKNNNTVPFVMVLEFEKVEEQLNNNQTKVNESKQEEDVFKMFGESINAEDYTGELPF